MSFCYLIVDCILGASRLREIIKMEHQPFLVININLSGGGIHPSLVPYDILTDREKKRDREAAMELLRFLQMHGYRIMGYAVDNLNSFV